MDKQEAKLLLQAYRPDGQDASHPAFAEALSLVEHDPELKAWWETQQAFDRKVTAKIKATPLPADLRATILAGRKIEQMTPGYRLPHWLAIAAVVAILCVIGVTQFPSSANAKIAKAPYDKAAIAFLGNDAPSLGMLSTDHSKVISWLKEQNSPTGSLPVKMSAIPSVGCQKFDVRGHTVSLICFSLASGEIVHLFVVDQKALSDPPGFTPEFQQMAGWSTASWSDGEKSYLLATEAGPDKLKSLL